MSAVISYISLTHHFLTIRYLLPCLVGASIGFAALMLGFFNLEEPKGAKDKKVPTVQAPSRSSSTSRAKAALGNSLQDRTHTGTETPTTPTSFSGTLFVDEEESTSAETAEFSIDTNSSAPPSALELLRHLPLRRVIASLFILSTVGTSYDMVFSLLCYTPIHLGGLSRTVRSLSFPVRYILILPIAP